MIEWNYTGGVPINQTNKKIDSNPYRKDIKKYLCEGYSPEEVCRWLNTKTDDPDELLSVATIRRVKYDHCPDVKTDKTKKLVGSQTNPSPKKSTKKKDIQTNFTIPSEDVTPEWLVQQFLNEIARRLPTFKDGNLVQGLNAVGRLINDKEIAVIDVEDTMRKFVTNDKLKEKVQNAKYDWWH